MTAEKVREALAVACEHAGSAAKWAKRHGLSRGYVSDILLGRRAPGESVLSPLGFEKIARSTVTYRRKNGART